MGAREIYVEQGAPPAPQVVAFVGPGALLAAHLGTVVTAYALACSPSAKFQLRSELPARPDNVGLHLHAVGRGAERTAGNTPYGDVLTPEPLIEGACLEATNQESGPRPTTHPPNANDADTGPRTRSATKGDSHPVSSYPVQSLSVGLALTYLRSITSSCTHLKGM